jgi:hypothetical protein
MSKNLDVKIFEAKELPADDWPGTPLCAGSLCSACLSNDERIEIAAQGQMSQGGCGNLRDDFQMD